jgi:hypothetical protein
LITRCRSLEGGEYAFLQFLPLNPVGTVWTGQTDPPDRSMQTCSHQ